MRVALLSCLFVLSTLAACTKDAPPPPADNKSVIEGGKAESAAGRKVEDAKREIDATEKQLQDRADDQFEKSAGENVERGVP